MSVSLKLQSHRANGRVTDKKWFYPFMSVRTQLTKNVSGTFGFGCMKVWLNLTLLERNAYVRHWSYKCLVEPNVLKTLFKYSDSV